MAIDRISGFNPSGLFLEKSPEISSGKKVEETGFKDALVKEVKSVNENMLKTQQMSQDFMLGNRQDLHEVMIALDKTDLEFRLMTQVRNKALDAYNEIMRMQV